MPSNNKLKFSSFFSLKCFGFDTWGKVLLNLIILFCLVWTNLDRGRSSKLGSRRAALVTSWHAPHHADAAPQPGRFLWPKKIHCPMRGGSVGKKRGLGKEIAALLSRLSAAVIFEAL